jgi:predicted ATPase
MITAIEIENFKGIGQRVRIPLRPITLLFGPNSAGKSTILQALHYAREVLERHNLDAGSTLQGGPTLDLGGFLNLVHNRDTSLATRIRLDFDLRGLVLPEFWRLGSVHNWIEDLDIQDGTASVEWEVRWSHLLGGPMVTAYETLIHEEPAGTLEASVEQKLAWVSAIGFDHPLFLDEDFDGEALVRISMLRELFERVRNIRDHGEPNLNLLLGERESALPAWEKVLSVEHPWAEGSEHRTDDVALFKSILSLLFVVPGQVLRDLLRGYRYLGPLRDIPPRSYEPARFADETRWANGLAAWDALWRNDEELVEKVGEWLLREDRLDSGYSVRRVDVPDLTADTELLVALQSGRAFEEPEGMALRFSRLPLKRVLTLLEEKTNLELLPQDVGVGISQMLPVVVAALAPGASLIAIEQPELHIHPRLQTALGDLFLETALGERRNRFLIETHSEHLMLRILRRIRETTEGELKANMPPVRPQDVAVLYVEPGPDGVQVHEIPIRPDGEFTRQWPRGFFDERATELFGEADAE